MITDSGYTITEGKADNRPYNLISQMIAEAVPPLVRQCVDEIMVDVRTTLNGKPEDLSGLKDDITRMVLDEIKKRF